jgi:hypothetical protein
LKTEYCNRNFLFSLLKKERIPQPRKHRVEISDRESAMIFKPLFKNEKKDKEVKQSLA